MMYEEIPASECEYLVAASTHYLGGARYVLRTRGLSGEVRNYIVDAAPFEHLRSMIEASIIEGLGDLDGD